MRSLFLLLSFCFAATAIYTAVQFRFTKVTTQGAIRSIREEFVQIPSVSEQQKKSFEFSASWILYNQQAAGVVADRADIACFIAAVGFGLAARVCQKIPAKFADQPS